MPRKLAKEPRIMRDKITQLKRIYGQDIMSRSSNLYQYCYYSFHSYDIIRLKASANDWKKKISLIQDVQVRKRCRVLYNEKFQYPFLKGGLRDLAMIYVFLLARMLRRKNLHFWDDATFIIYFTYYTAFTYNSLEQDDFNYPTLQLVHDRNGGMACKDFKKGFSFIADYDLLKVSHRRNLIKEKLREKEKSFKKKFKDGALVEIFIKKSEDIIQNGL